MFLYAFNRFCGVILTLIIRLAQLYVLQVLLNIILYPVFLFQIPVAPLQGREEMHSPSDSRMPNSITYEDVLDDQGIPTMITWTHGGMEVFVEGSWDNWKTKYWPLDLVCQNLFLLIVCGGSMRLCFVCVIAGNPCKGQARILQS